MRVESWNKAKPVLRRTGCCALFRVPPSWAVRYPSGRSWPVRGRRPTACTRLVPSASSTESIRISMAIRASRPPFSPAPLPDQGGGMGHPPPPRFLPPLLSRGRSARGLHRGTAPTGLRCRFSQSPDGICGRRLSHRWHETACSGALPRGASRYSPA